MRFWRHGLGLLVSATLKDVMHQIQKKGKGNGTQYVEMVVEEQSATVFEIGRELNALRVEGGVGEGC